MATPDEHKVRGGSALSIALGKVSPSTAGLSKSSPVDSACSASSHHTAGWLSLSTGSPLASPSPSPAGDALAHATSASTLSHRQQQQQQRRRIPLLSCFSMAGTMHRGDDADVRLPVAVSASEVGIRPCFYWLEAPTISEEDRMFAEANARWLKSDCQDDAVVIEHFGGHTHQTFAGVFDGHGPYGRNAAKFATTRLPQLLAAKLAAASSERKRLRALRDSFLEVNKAMRDISAAGFDASLSGTTACCALVVGRKVFVASSGDSRCMVARRGLGGELEAVPLTWDAKPSLPEEQSRILLAGGVVKQLLDEQGQRVGAYRVFRRGDDVLPGLAMSRSLGDLYAHAVGVSPEPILNTYTLGDRDLFLILATDGLWDIMDNTSAADFVERYRGRRDVHVSCAEALTLEAQERWKALHDEAIVDDISCVILHTAGLPPPEREDSLPQPLARAASCNDEANEIYMQWRLERERNPSNHKPQQYFKHLYGEEEGETEEVMAAAVAVAAPGGGGCLASEPQPVAAPPALQAADAAGTPPVADSSEAPTPPVSPSLCDTLLYARPIQRSDSNSASVSVVAASTAAAAVPRPAAVDPPHRLWSPDAEHGSSGVLHRMDDFSSQSPNSSFGDLGSENSEPSTGRGGAFSNAWGEMQVLLQRHSTSRPQPIPMHRLGSSEEGPLSLPLEALLRPVRKAYPSNSNMQGQLSSYRSDASMTADMPRSGDMEKKVRGGMSRSLSHHPLHSTHASVSSLHSHGHAAASLPSSSRLSTELLSRHRSHQEERLVGSGTSSPSGESFLGTTLSPQTSPVVVPLGSYSQVQMAAQSGPVLPATAAAATSGTGIDAKQYSRVPPGASDTDVDTVRRNAHLSRTATDCTGLVEAAVAVSKAGGDVYAVAPVAPAHPPGSPGAAQS